jgi:hypothetical protein
LCAVKDPIITAAQDDFSIGGDLVILIAIGAQFYPQPSSVIVYWQLHPLLSQHQHVQKFSKKSG